MALDHYVDITVIVISGGCVAYANLCRQLYLILIHLNAALNKTREAQNISKHICIGQKSP